MLNLFGKTKPTCRPDPDVLALLKTVRADEIPDPTVLRPELDRLTRQIEAAEAEWERLDRRSDDAAFLRMTPLAERLQELRPRADALPLQIADAERRRGAFVELAEQFDRVGADVEAKLRTLIERPPHDPQQRNQQIRLLDDATRLHARLASRLRTVSTDRRFREPADAISTLRDELRARIRELDRLRLPGPKPPVSWPHGIKALLDAIHDVARKEPAI